MNIKYYIKTLFASINPKSYRTLANRKLKEAFNFFFLTLVFALVLFLILYVPSTLLFSNNLANKLDQIDVFKLDAEVVHKEPVELFKTPKVVLDLNKTNFTDADILITNNNIFYKKFMMFGETSIDLNEISDLKNNSNINFLLTTILIFLIPTILVGLFILFTIKNILLAFIITIVSYLFYMITRHQVKLSSLFKSALYATSVMLILDVLLLLFFPLLWISLIFYVILFVFASWWLAQKRFSIKKRKQQEFPDKKE